MEQVDLAVKAFVAVVVCVGFVLYGFMAFVDFFKDNCEEIHHNNKK